jgi:predicted N-acyltransferase
MSSPQSSGLKLGRVDRAADIAADVWNACANPSHRDFNPFLQHAFFCAAENSGSATPETGWTPCHLTLSENDKITAILPLYLKTHSQGEYIFDHMWADAFERAGGSYYPKLLSAVPFTPATGARLLTSAADDAGETRQAKALLRGAEQMLKANNLSSLHLNFVPEASWKMLGGENYLLRKDQQFHWLNDGFESFDAFLDALSSRKRKNLKKERARAIENGIAIEWFSGDDICPTHWDAFFEFYIDTGMRKWGRPYLTRKFFDLIHESMRQDILLILAKRNGRYIAGALNFIGSTTLYGRNWGCIEDHPFLHFELCYYQAVEFAISRGLHRVEAGAQGAHKIARGYLPCPTYSAHYVTHDGFREALAQYLSNERAHVDNDIEILNQYTPFKKETDHEIG